jgi:hypothetical protein
MLEVNAPDDHAEREADRIADQVVAGPPRAVNAPLRAVAPTGSSDARTPLAPPSVEQTLAGVGAPLEGGLCRDMEQRFGYDFSRVRIHSGPVAERSARELSAAAYTVGERVVFAAGRYAPGTNEGRRLIAHELTHVVQQSGARPLSATQSLEPARSTPQTRPAPLRVSRFGEGEHKKLGNLATTTYPYFAVPSTDEVGLRSSPKGPQPDDRFRNLVASLRKGVRVLVVSSKGKWMRVMVYSGTVLDGTTNKPVNGAGLTGYVSQELLTKEPGVFDQNLPVLPGISLTYGDFTALGGDHFRQFLDLEEYAKSPGGGDNIKKFVDVVEGRRQGEFEDPKTIDKAWADRFKDLALDNVSHFSLGGTALETWKKGHYRALMTAAVAGVGSDVSGLQRAYAMNGFADHFLTDSFSSGHVRTPRVKILESYQAFFDQHLDSILNYIFRSIGDQMIVQAMDDYPNRFGLGLVTHHDFCANNREAITEFRKKAEEMLQDQHLGKADIKKLVVKYVGGAVAKALHDADNQGGLQVKSKKHPEGWKAFGDGRLEPMSQKYIVEAVQVSKDEIVEAFNIGIDFKKPPAGVKLFEKIKPLVYPVSKIEDYIPETDKTKSRPQPEWRLDVTGWDMMDKPVQDRVTAIVANYLSDEEIEKIIKPIPAAQEVEITGPNVDVRPRDAARHVLREFRAKPVDFIISGALEPASASKSLERAVFCQIGL